MESVKSCGGIVFRKKGDVKYLLIKHKEEGGGHWDFPKGHIESGESEEVTALRELKEETGIDHAKIIPGFKGEITYYFTRQRKTIRKK